MKRPGHNQHLAPDVVTQTDGGILEIFFRRKENAPAKYDYSTPHRTNKSMRVYFRFVPTVTMILILACGLGVFAAWVYGPFLNGG